MKTFVFLDTNIFVRFISQGKPGCEQTHWDYLVEQLKAQAVTLVLPEVVKLETERQWALLPELLKSKLLAAKTKLDELVKGSLTHSEIQDIGSNLLNRFDELQLMKTEEMEERYRNVLQLFDLQTVQHVELKVETWLSAKKRLMAGKFGGNPEADVKKDADSCILESLIDFFSRQQGDVQQLLFCSENGKDFGVELEKGKWTLHPNNSPGMPLTEFVVALDSLCNFIREDKEIEAPKPEAIKEAVEKEEERQVIERADLIRQFEAAFDRRASNSVETANLRATASGWKTAKEDAERYVNLAGLDRLDESTARMMRQVAEDQRRLNEAIGTARLDESTARMMRLAAQDERLLNESLGLARLDESTARMMRQAAEDQRRLNEAIGAARLDGSTARMLQQAAEDQRRFVEAMGAARLVESNTKMLQRAAEDQRRLTEAMRATRVDDTTARTFRHLDEENKRTSGLP